MDALVSDRRAVVAPDYEKPFSSVEDAINRLLPYHIYQYPKGDLDSNQIPLERQGNIKYAGSGKMRYLPAGLCR